MILTLLIVNLLAILAVGVLLMSLLDDLSKDVSDNSDVIQSAITLLTNIKQKLDEAGTDPVKLKALSDQLESNNNALAAAVAANTPAE